MTNEPQSPPQIKICGITRSEDVTTALSLGVDYLGFNFYPPSPRYLKPAAAQTILTRAKKSSPPLKPSPRPKIVGVFVNETKENIIQAVREVPLDIVQLHGDESAAFANALGLPFWKVLRVKDRGGAKRLEKSISQALASYQCETFLLDTFSKAPGVYGGTGQPFDWQMLETLKQRHSPRSHSQKKIRFILAGGLNLENIKKARRLGVDGFDINSGIEEGPGLKHAGKMKAMVKAIQGPGT